MSDTPETDAVDGKPTWQADIVEVGWVQSDFARRLERELKAERALADRLAKIVEVGIEDLDESDGDWPQAFAAVTAWKEARTL